MPGHGAVPRPVSLRIVRSRRPAVLDDRRLLLPVHDHGHCICMLNPDGRTSETLNDAGATVFQLLGGELLAVDTWTRVDFSWMHEGSASSRDAVGYAGLPMSYRVAGLTLGDADAAPSCPPFIVEIWPERLIAQVVWQRDERYRSRLAEADLADLHHWAAGSLTKNLRVVRFPDGDVALEADLYVADSTPIASLREFITAFSWDVAALHACETDGTLRTTEEWVRLAALSISRATPVIPLREHIAPEWHSWESPRGVFCSLQPSGGLCESDNVLYSVRRDASMLEPLTTMPGHRIDWETSRLTEIWLSRDGATCFARSLLLDGYVTTKEGTWRPIGAGKVTAITPWQDHGFLLGLHDGRVAVLDGAQTIALRRRLTKLRGRFSRLVAVGDRAIGLIGSTVVSARVQPDANGRKPAAEAWDVSLELSMSFDNISELDVDRWAASPAVAVLGDETIALFDAHTGAPRARYAVHQPKHVKWIGPGLLMVLDALESRAEARTRVRVLDAVSGRWTEPVVTAYVSRVAVRGDEIHVGFANQSIAVWDRHEVCRGIGAWTFRSDVPEGTVGGADATVHVTPPAATPISVSGTKDSR